MAELDAPIPDPASPGKPDRLIAAILAAFTPPPGRHRAPDMSNDAERSSIAAIAATIGFIRARMARDFYRDDDLRRTRLALRTLAETLPRIIAVAEREAGEGGDFSFDLERAAEMLSGLHAAVQPFTEWSRERDDRRGSWHWAARVLADWVRALLDRQRATADFGHEASAAIEIARRLLRLCKIQAEPAAIVEVLRTRGK